MTKRKLETTCDCCLRPFQRLWSHQIYCDLHCALAARVVVGGPDECWLWTGAKNDQGYGQLSVRGRRHYAHRLAYELGREPLGDRVIIHKCDTPACCNPAHMEAGTQAENLADMHRKGRWILTPAKGEAVGGARLTEVDVRAIRTAITAGEALRALARRYGVSQGAIQGIARGRTWRHVS